MLDGSQQIKTATMEFSVNFMKFIRYLKTFVPGMTT